MRFRILIVMFVLLLAACASNRGGYTEAKSVENRLNQLSESELAMKLGAPTEKVQLTDGSMVWTYRDKSEGLTGGECTISVVMKNGRVMSSTVTARDRSWVSYPLGSCVNIIANLD